MASPAQRYPIRIYSHPVARDESGRLTLVLALVAETVFAEVRSAVWLARAGVVVICASSAAKRWKHLGDGLRVSQTAPLDVRVAQEAATSALILPPLVEAAANFAASQEIFAIGSRGVLLVVREIQADYWEPRFWELAATCA